MLGVSGFSVILSDWVRGAEKVLQQIGAPQWLTSALNPGLSCLACWPLLAFHRCHFLSSFRRLATTFNGIPANERTYDTLGDPTLGGLNPLYRRWIAKEATLTICL